MIFPEITGRAEAGTTSPDFDSVFWPLAGSVIFSAHAGDEKDNVDGCLAFSWIFFHSFVNKLFLLCLGVTVSVDFCPYI